MVAHNALASVTSIPELAMDKDEADTLGKALGEVLSHYDVSFLDDKTTAWINLGQTLFGLYGTRLMAARLRKAAERQEALQRASDEARTVSAAPSPSAPSYTPTTFTNESAQGDRS